MGRGATRLLLIAGVLVVGFGALAAPTAAATDVGSDDVANATAVESATANATAVEDTAANATAADVTSSIATTNATGSIASSTVAANAAQSTATASGGSNVELTQHLRLVPERPGVYGVAHRYRLPEGLRRLEVTLPAESTIVSTTGFDRREDRTYEWDGATSNPRIEYRTPANRTVDQTGPIGAPGRLTFVDVGEWALVSAPATSHSWGWVGTESVGFERSMTTDEGATGGTVAYLGPHEEYTHTAHGQEFRLIVPDAADLEESPEELFASLSAASDRLRVGDRDETVFLVAAPTPEGIEWGVRGLHTGGSDMWVRDVERLDEANNVWLHEYVHSRQAYTAAEDSRWFTEASAVYYAALLTLEQERITYPEFRARLALGERDYGGSVLTEPDTWQRNANYHVGALVAGELDRQIRLSTGGDASLQEPFRRMNAKGDVVAASDVRSYLSVTGGDSVARASDRYTKTTTRPTAWSVDEHREAFGDLPDPARITYAIPSGGDAVRVGGPYRNRSLGSERPVVLVPGERLGVDVVATNFGGNDGDYEATLRVDDEPLTTRTGQLAPEESTTLTFEHAFDSPGERVVSVGDATLRVSVREPAPAQVSSFSANRTDLSAGEWVELSANVRNDADYPGEVALAFARDGEPFETRTVRLDAGADATVTTAVRLEEPGTYVFGLGNASSETAVVTVPAGNAGDGGEQTDTGTPGFGPVVAVVGVVALGVAAVVRRNRAE
ncbi:hypothetical protein [Halobellus rarus]|uniref:Glycyl aminopeptidase n=1 Tax=Halobellus rarus TaxID=1126237 RepID=A0ABD6CKZ1_9EURY|nr:hypothetical protein [Halobellus rarus]